MGHRGTLAYTKDLADEVIAGIAVGLTDEDACATVGISTDTLERWRKHRSGCPAEVAARLRQARPRRTRRWLSQLSTNAAAGDTRAIEALLDRCAPDYRKVQKIDQTITLDVRTAAEKVAADLGIPVDVVLAETYRLAEEVTE